jgi:hypothetical protein
MNRRSFIWKALAGLAAVPVIGKLVQALPERDMIGTPLSSLPKDCLVVKTQFATLEHFNNEGIEWDRSGYFAHGYQHAFPPIKPLRLQVTRDARL